MFARRTLLLAVARDGVYSLGGENIRCGELGSTRRATKNTRCGELGTTRQATKYTRWASDDIFSLRKIEHSPWRAIPDRSANRPLFSLKTLILTTPNPKIDRKHYLLIFYNLDITSLLSYPHFGPKNTRLNFFLFLIVSNSLCLFYSCLLCVNRTFCCFRL